MKKKLISQLVCVTMALSLTSVSALAEETNAAAEVNEGAAEGKEEGKEEPQEEEQAAPQLNTMEQRSNAVAVQANDGETKNITKTGLTLGNTDNPLPTEETTYAAGGGTVTFIPAIPPATEGENGTKAKLVLDNAEINCPGFTAIAFKSEEDLDIELKGTNVFTANNGIASEGNLNIIGEGTLKIKGTEDGIESEGGIAVNSGTIEISDFQSVRATRAGLRAKEGDVTINGGTVTIRSEESDIHGIYASPNSKDEFGTVYIDGGKVDINVKDRGIYAGKNIVIDDKADVDVISTDDDGLHSYEGNITIGGNAVVKVVSEDDDGIYADKGKVEISGSANVTINPLTAFVISVSESPEVYSATAYGKCDTNNYDDDISKLEVKEDTELTVDRCTHIEIANAENLTVDGKIINNGTIVIPAEDCTKLTGKLTNNNMLTIIADDSVDAAEMIQGMGMEDGDGIIRVSNSDGSVSSMYTNDGTQLKTQEAIVIKDIADTTDNTPTGEYFDENGKGYSWNAATKVLTLKNIVPNKVEITSANDVTIQIVGTAYVVEEFKFFGGETFQNKTVTITGERVKARYIKFEKINVVIATQKVNIEIIQNVFSLESGRLFLSSCFVGG